MSYLHYLFLMVVVVCHPCLPHIAFHLISNTSCLTCFPVWWRTCLVSATILSSAATPLTIDEGPITSRSNHCFYISKHFVYFGLKIKLFLSYNYKCFFSIEAIFSTNSFFCQFFCSFVRSFLCSVGAPGVLNANDKHIWNLEFGNFWNILSHTKNYNLCWS